MRSRRAADIDDKAIDKAINKAINRIHNARVGQRASGRARALDGGVGGWMD